MRTSSINPEKYSPHTPFPPIFNADVDVAIDPATATACASTPSTNTRNIDPSYVTATCDHPDVDNADPATAAESTDPTCTYPDGPTPPPDEYNPYDNPPGASFNTTVRHPADVDGCTH